MNKPKRSGRLHISAGSVDKEFRRLIKLGIRKRIVPSVMNRDASVFSPDRNLRKLISNRLGWVDVCAVMKKKIPQIEAFGKEALRDGLRHLVLIGMGGSSLCPEMFGIMFGHHPRLKSYQIIDSTDPASIRGLLRKVELKKTLFIVASKSGGTIETRSHEAFFLEQLLAVGVSNPGKNFAAITDAGSDLHKFARKNKYRKVFLNPADIGGRYSALSYFGLVPAWFASVDLKRLLDDTLVMETILRERDDETNPALLLAAWMAATANAGRDKMTMTASRGAAPLIPWIEQLVAESTGKKRKGIMPVGEAQLGKVTEYARDRAFVVLRMGRQKAASDTVYEKIDLKRLPRVEIMLSDKYSIGGHMLLWMAATAAAGKLLRVNPFDEPNVTESKDITKRILSGTKRKSGHEPASVRFGKLTLFSGGGRTNRRMAEPKSLSNLMKKFLRSTRPPRYLAIMNFCTANPSIDREISDLRAYMRKKRGLTLVHGYGPRYLHSTGQLYKGGPANGLFIILVRSRYGKVEVPGKPYSFGDLITAQALGDAGALAGRKYPTIVLAYDGSPVSAIESLNRAVRTALRK